MAIAVDMLIGNPTNVVPALNATVQQQLQNSYALDFLSFRLTGSLTLSSYTAAPTKLVESVENLIASLQLVATGRSSGATTDTLCNVGAAYLRFKTRMMEGTDVTRTDVSTANGVYAFETNFKRYFSDPRSKASSLTRLFTDGLSSLMANYQFRDQNAMVTGGTGGTASLSGLNLTVQARQYLGLQAPNPSPFVKESQRKYNIVASQNDFRCDRVPVGNTLRRQYIKGMVGATNYSDPSDLIFGATNKTEGPHVSLVLANNGRKILDQVYQQLHNDNKALFATESMPAGYAIYEPSRNARVATSIPLGNVPNADNYIDVAYQAGYTNTIEITDEEIVGLSVPQFINN